MWRPSVNFITVHYAYIIFMGLLSLPILYPYGNLTMIDAYFFGASASTESGLNTYEIRDLALYQQLYIYFVPMFTNLGFINIMVVVVRLRWFNKRINHACHLLSARRRLPVDRDATYDLDAPGVDLQVGDSSLDSEFADVEKRPVSCGNDGPLLPDEQQAIGTVRRAETSTGPVVGLNEKLATTARHLSTEKLAYPEGDATLDVTGSRGRECGMQIAAGDCVDRNRISHHDQATPKPQPKDDVEPLWCPSTRSNGFVRECPMPKAKSFNRGVGMARLINKSTARSFDLFARSTQEHEKGRGGGFRQQAASCLSSMSDKPTRTDREELGGVEYRSLKLLLKIITAYYFGVHLLGGIGLACWIQHADPKYTTYLQAMGQDKTWWAFYTAQSLMDNLGFTLTPDNMVHFNDAVWPLLLLSFLGLAGETLYPVFLRLIIWTMSKLTPGNSRTQKPLAYLLNHPRRCYTLLFPSGTTWALFGITVTLNLIDSLLIVILDLHNPEVARLALGNRVVAAFFQSVAARHAGTTPYTLANVSPAVQFSLLVMMYISIYPITMSIRTSNAYEEGTVGIYQGEPCYNEKNGGAYLLRHMQHQLGFDLWYIFLGIFCLAVSESSKVSDPSEDSIKIFPIFFEVVSAYANVGIGLGHPSTASCLSTKFSIFGKLVVCATMIRGRHRGMPYRLDRAIMLPDEHLVEESVDAKRLQQPG